MLDSNNNVYRRNSPDAPQPIISKLTNVPKSEPSTTTGLVNSIGKTFGFKSKSDDMGSKDVNIIKINKIYSQQEKCDIYFKIIEQCKLNKADDCCTIEKAYEQLCQSSSPNKRWPYCIWGST